MPDVTLPTRGIPALLNAEPFRTFREKSEHVQATLDELLSKEIPAYTSEDTSLVVFGSLARGEWTSGSDLDWTYLIDGQANSDHLRISQKIQGTLEKLGYVPPGATGTFGNLAFSHDIIHQIGGQYDTNRNTTQRILLLLESCPIGSRSKAHERVLRGAISRYLEEDTHPLTHGSKHYRVPRFLLNDMSDSGEQWRSTLQVNSGTEPVKAGVFGMRSSGCQENLSSLPACLSALA